MKRRISILPIVALLLTTGCITTLRVSTEVYDGPLPPDPLPSNAARVGALADTALTNYGTRAADTAAETYGTVVQRLAQRYPRFIDGSAIEAFRGSFRIAAVDAVEPAMTSAAVARSLAQQLRALSCPAKDATGCDVTVPSDAVIQQWVAALRAKLAETSRLGRTAIQAINDAEAAQVRSLIETNFRRVTTEHDVELRRITQLPIRNAAERTLAIDAAAAQAEAETRDLLAADDAILASLLVSEPLNAQVTATEIIPLHDPAVKEILKNAESDAKVWKKYVNDVVSNNQFGNAEIAFRMDGLGDSHIKGVMFDASQAMKTGFSVLAKTVEATASAFGGAVFDDKPQTGTKQNPTTEEGGKLSPGTTPAASKPVIEAELALLGSAGSMRRDTMESLFWNVATLGKNLPTPADAPAAEAAKKLLALVKCAQDEITDPKGRRCGGEE